MTELEKSVLILHLEETITVLKGAQLDADKLTNLWNGEKMRVEIGRYGYPTLVTKLKIERE